MARGEFMRRIKWYVDTVNLRCLSGCFILFLLFENNCLLINN